MSFDPQSESFEKEVKEAAATMEKVMGEVGRVVVGQKNVALRLLMAAVAEGHVLLEGLPGLAKTTSITALASACDLSFRRIQFTPDLLPADVIGTQIYDPRTSEFHVKQGPVFANLVLADEINRAPAKVQSALLEAMQERQVTIGEDTFQLQRPFLVMATQNPIEQEGTYPLPEAQVDRFLFKVIVKYGSLEEEQEIMARAMELEAPSIAKVINAHRFHEMKSLVHGIHVAEKVRRYIAQLVFATRQPADYGLADLQHMIEVGASPRASINLERAARINAMFQGRPFVTPQDVKDVGFDVLRHRIMTSYEAEAEGVSEDQIVGRIFDSVDVP